MHANEKFMWLERSRADNERLKSLHTLANVCSISGFIGAGIGSNTCVESRPRWCAQNLHTLQRVNR